MGWARIAMTTRLAERSPAEEKAWRREETLFGSEPRSMISAADIPDRRKSPTQGRFKVQPRPLGLIGARKRLALRGIDFRGKGMEVGVDKPRHHGPSGEVEAGRKFSTGWFKRDRFDHVVDQDDVAWLTQVRGVPVEDPRI
jgi:hypothetical protein